MEIREVRAGEYERAGQIVVDAYRSVPNFPLDEDYAAELASVERRAKEAMVLVAVAGDELVGCVTYVPDDGSPLAELLENDEAGVRMLATAASRWGRGIGEALVVACIDRAVSAGRRALLLHSATQMEAAHRLYERLGFVRAPERDWSPV